MRTFRSVLKSLVEEMDVQKKIVISWNLYVLN